VGKIVMVALALAFGSVASVFSAPTVLADDWSLDWKYVGEKVEFVLEGPTTGWVSVGFNPSTGMKDAEYIMAYVEDGAVKARQDFGTGRFTHASVESLGWTETLEIVSGRESGGVTTVTFRLPREWGEAYGARFLEGQTYKVLFAYGRDNRDDFTSKHRKHAVAMITF
jgi:hypothetical protein